MTPALPAPARAPSLFTRLLDERRGVAMIEFAFSLPPLLLMLMGGAELANYTITRMRVSQMALAIADNAARMGNGPQMSAKTIAEVDINDVFIGAQMQSGKLKLKENGRVILSDVEPVATPNATNRFKIGWQRCFGDRTHPSTYGSGGDTDLTGVGPAGQQINAPDDSATMFVEVYYNYTPLIARDWIPNVSIVEIASMPVRDRRNLTSAIDNTAGVAVSSC